MRCKYDLSKLLNSAKLAPEEANLALYNMGGKWALEQSCHQLMALDLDLFAQKNVLALDLGKRVSSPVLKGL